MKRKIAKILIIIFLFNIVFTNEIFASIVATENTKVSVDLKDLDNDTRNTIINKLKEVENKQNQLAQTQVETSIDNAKKFAEYGKSVAIAIQEVCKVLNVEVNAFVKTPVGNTVMWLIIYHVIGKDLLKIVLSFFIWFLITIILSFTLSRFHLPQKVKIKNEETKEVVIKYQQKYVWKDETAKCFSAVAHFAIFILSTLILIYKVL